jgi:hypothetical protein
MSTTRFGGGQVFQKVNVSVLSVPRMVYWTSLRLCESYVSYSPSVLFLSIRMCATSQLSPMWIKISHGCDNFQKLILTQTSIITRLPCWHGSYNGQQGHVQTLCQRSDKDIMDKYYEMFRVKNSESSKKKKTLLTTRQLNEEWVVCVRETSLSFNKITQSLIH